VTDQQIDWRHLAEVLGTITWTESGHNELGGEKVARDALTRFVGDNALREAVDLYVTFAPGFELARSVLRLLKPTAAMVRCRQIFRESDNEEQAASAIELLRFIADKRVLDWVPEFLASDNRSVKIWGIGVIDQLWMDGEIDPGEGWDLLDEALSDPDPIIRENAQRIFEMWNADRPSDNQDRGAPKD